MSDIVLILGSAPNAVEAKPWRKSWFDRLVVINNAWRVRSDWDHLIHPEDFPADRHPPQIDAHQRVVRADDYVPLQNDHGGFVYAGGTMAFTAGYWALAALKPRVMAFMGCDMVYPSAGKSHFYGSGAADPLRDDVTLRDLSAKSARLALHAARCGCACVNLSTAPSRLLFDRASPDTLRSVAPVSVAAAEDACYEAEQAERRLGYMVPSGRYWDEADRFDPAALDAIDRMWRAGYDSLSQQSAA